MLLANHGALTVGGDLYSAYYKMETVEHFAQISLVARMLGRENLISRQEVLRLQGLRGTYGIQAPAPICLDPEVPGSSTPAQTVVTGSGEDQDAATCQTVQAPTGTGSRLVPALDFMNEGRSRASAALRQAAGGAGDEAEIRLTYRELSALIEDAIRNLR
jgi:L-fuculose-phosphate aldolase